MHTYTHTHACKYLYILMWIYSRICKCIYINLPTGPRIRDRTFVYINMYMHIHIYKGIYICISAKGFQKTRPHLPTHYRYTCMYIYIYMYMHTHICKGIYICTSTNGSQNMRLYLLTHYIYTCRYIPICICLYIFIKIYTSAHLPTGLRIRDRAFSLTTYTHARLHIHVYI